MTSMHTHSILNHNQKRTKLEHFDLPTILEGYKRSYIESSPVMPYTSLELIQEITGQLSINKESNIAVMFTYEWALYLRYKGYKKVTLLTDEESTFFAGACNWIGAEYMTFNNIGNRKFDIVVGNPPFQDSNRSLNVRPGGGKGNIYPKFVDLAWELLKPEGEIGFVVPTSFFTNTQWLKPSKKNELTLSRQICCVKTGIESHFRVGTAICYFVAQNIVPKRSPSVNGSAFNIYTYKFIPKYTSKVGLSILEKITSGTDKFNFQRDKVPNGEGVMFKGLQGAKVSSTGQIKFHDEEYGGTNGHIYHKCNNQEDFKNLMSSQIFRFFIRNIKVNNSMYPGIMNGMTMPPKERMSDDELYAYFKLTQEEIDLIEKNV
jgi:hypothetical protein